MQLRYSLSISSRSRYAYQSAVASSYTTSLYDSISVVVDWFLNADMNIMTALYSAG